MARKTRHSKTHADAPRRHRYSAGEWFMAGLGALVLILVLGMIVTALFQGK